MTDPAETLDAIEQALQGIWTDVDTEEHYKTVPRVTESLAHLATLKQQVVELVAFRETHQWQPIDTAPKDGSTFHINSGPVPGNACCSNVEEPGCGIEWRYNTLRTQGWTNSLTSLATHWQPLPTPPAAEVTPSADLLTAAPLVEALKFAEHAARALYSSEAKVSFVKLYTPVYGVDGHLSQALIIQALQQALADAATIAEHSADLCQFINQATKEPPSNVGDLIEERMFIFQAAMALPPSVRDIVGRGGR
jgi:hypothetical protein